MSINTPKGSLSSVVSNLVRSSLGSSGSGIADDDLDRHVAEILAKEAKDAEKRSREVGVLSAYLSDDEEPWERKPRTNKRFLSTVLKGVDDHNSNIASQRSHSNTPNSSEKRNLPETTDRGRRDASSSHWALGRIQQQLNGNSQKSNRKSKESENSNTEKRRDTYSTSLSNEDNNRHPGETTSRTHSRSRSPHHSRGEKGDGYDTTDSGNPYIRKTSLSKYRSRSRSPHGSRREREEGYDYAKGESSTGRGREHDYYVSTKSSLSSRKRYEDQSHSSKKKYKRYRSNSDTEEDYQRDPREKNKPKCKSRLKSPLHQSESTEATSAERVTLESSSSASAATSKSKNIVLTSKMDKYFSDSYDPRLDVSVDDITDSKTGFIGEGNFDEWSSMLQALQARKEYKQQAALDKWREDEEEKRRLERKEDRAKRREAKKEKRKQKEDKREKRKRSSKHRHSGTEDDSDSSSVGPQPEKGRNLDSDSTGIMSADRNYTKQGAVRPWDQGKSLDF